MRGNIRQRLPLEVMPVHIWFLMGKEYWMNIMHFQRSLDNRNLYTLGLQMEKKEFRTPLGVLNVNCRIDIGFP